LIVSQANLKDYYRVLKRLQKCEGINVLRQAGVRLLRRNIPRAEGGVLVLRETRVLRLLQCSHTPIRPERTEVCSQKGMPSMPCIKLLTAGDSLMSHDGRHREPERPVGICWALRPGVSDDNTMHARPPNATQSSGDH
jgi:hypothetical protein